MPLPISRRLAGLAGLVVCIFSLGRPVVAAGVDRVDVFKSGEDGYHTYRIPAILPAPNGDLLAFCEGRRVNGGDSGDIDLLLKRSSDGGRTWGATQVLWDDADNTCGNPCPVVDKATGTIWLLSTHNIGSDKEAAIVHLTSHSSRTVWVLQSKDQGKTWTKPAEITAAVKDPSWTWYATGPGVGIQIQAGPHAGRLVIPCDHNYRNADGKNVAAAHAMYSDDHGATWQSGASIEPGMNECQVVERYDGQGTLLMDMRSYLGHACRAEATSADGGQTWTPSHDVPVLTEEICQASILRFATDAAGAKGWLLFSNPDHPKKRLNLTVRASTDDGATWSRALSLGAGPAAYSCLVQIDQTTAGCLYENGTKRPYELITLALFHPSDLPSFP